MGMLDAIFGSPEPQKQKVTVGYFNVDATFTDGTKLSEMPYYEDMKLTNLSKEAALEEKENIEENIVNEYIQTFDIITINWKFAKCVFIVNKLKGETNGNN
jgi:hypothetical protein